MSVYKGLDEGLKKTIFTLNTYMDENFSREKGTFRSNNSFCGIKNDIEVYISIDNDVISKMSLYQQKDLGNYHRVGDYDFLVDLNSHRLDVNIDNLESSQDFKKLIELKFRKTTKEYINDYLLDINYSAQTGDKNSLYISKEISISLKKNEKSYELLDIIKSLIENF